jgi:hypothetical protein
MNTSCVNKPFKHIDASQATQVAGGVACGFLAPQRMGFYCGFRCEFDLLQTELSGFPSQYWPRAARGAKTGEEITRSSRGIKL